VLSFLTSACKADFFVIKFALWHSRAQSQDSPKEGRMTINWRTVGLVAVLLIAVALAQTAIQMGPQVRLEREYQALEERVGGLEGTVLAVVSATCVKEASPNPDVPLAHPRVIFNHTGFPFSHWVEIVVRDQNGATLYRVVYSGPNETGRTVFDGEFSDISSRATHVFSPDAGYTVRVWNHPYEDGAPQFEERDLAYENWFSVPVCR